MGGGGDAGADGAGEVHTDAQARLARLNALTPGDFAAVVRQSEMLGAPMDAPALVQAIEHEHQAKAAMGGGAIGFV